MKMDIGGPLSRMNLLRPTPEIWVIMVMLVMESYTLPQWMSQI